jgi:ubiquinone/menaquinone biosynthesis C-methylase UbiE
MSETCNVLKKRVEREQAAHANKDVLAESYKLKARFPHITQYPSIKRYFAVVERFLRDLKGKTVLDYGCGRGAKSLEYLALGAVTYGIDISPVYIAHAEAEALKAGYHEDEYSFQVMDAHTLQFEENKFDMVFGFGILHHLEASTAFDEICRVLKPGGRVLLQEPLADNFLLKMFRLLTPKARTKDERPFTKEDIELLTSKKQWKSELFYCGLIEAPLSMVTSMVVPKKPDNYLLKFADKIEQYTHDRNLLLSWNQYVLFNMQKK